jgi:CRISPR-associated endoribonuclease Cas6
VKGQTKVTKTGLQYNSKKVTIVFSCLSEDFAKQMVQALYKKEFVELGELVLEPDTVEKEKDSVLGEVVKYISISPIMVAPRSAEDVKEFIDPNDDRFSDSIYETTMLRMEKTGLYSEEDFKSFFKFQIVPDNEYLKKIKQKNKKFSRIYTTGSLGQGDEFRGYTFPFTLFADPKVQQFIFTCGFGDFANNGFGMLDIANIDPLGRIVEYDFGIQKAVKATV